MVTYELRSADPSERAILRALHERSSLIWEEDRDVLSAHPEVLGVSFPALEAGRVRVAVRWGAQVIGFSTVTSAGGDACVLDDLFVEPEFMRRGVGAALVADAATRAHRAGRRVMTVVAHQRTLRFYERNGFGVVGSAETEFGPALQLQRRLSAGDDAGEHLTH